MKTIDEMLEVMQAFKDGKEIECKSILQNEWLPAVGPLWNWCDCDYRVKSEPKYVPYNSVTEVNIDKWLRRKDNPLITRKITIVNYAREWIYLEGAGWCTTKELFEHFEYNDGTPCGKLKGEQK